MRTSAPGIELIKSFEGFRAEVYACPAGYPTIGYGHVIRVDETFSNTLTEQEATALLQNDLQRVECAISRLIHVALWQNQFDALVSFTFNLGSGALQRSTLRRKINRQEHGEAASEFLKWVWAGGRRQKGLLRRRQAEARLYGLADY